MRARASLVQINILFVKTICFVKQHPEMRVKIKKLDIQYPPININCIQKHEQLSKIALFFSFSKSIIFLQKYVN